MGEVSEFSLSTRLFLKSYRWRRIDPVPWSPLSKPLAETRVGLVSSAGLVLPGQEPFDDKMRGGDYTMREIPADTDVSTLIETHRSETFDHRGVQSDPNVAFPIDRMRELAEDGTIGSLAATHISFMGSITAPGRLLRHSVPKMIEVLTAERIEAALLVPI